MLLDGELIESFYERTEAWDPANPPTELDFCYDGLKKGNHWLEVFGSATCCDNPTSWQFKVDDDDWKDFTTENLDTYNKFPPLDLGGTGGQPERQKSMLWYGTHTFEQPNLDLWFPITIDNGTFEDPIVMVGPVSSNDITPVTVRVRNVRRDRIGIVTFEMQMQEWT